MGLFWIFGGQAEPRGGGLDFLATVHSIDEAHAWLAANSQTWYQIFVWRDNGLQLEEPKVTPKKKSKIE